MRNIKFLRKISAKKLIFRKGKIVGYVSEGIKVSRSRHGTLDKVRHKTLMKIYKYEIIQKFNHDAL